MTFEVVKSRRVTIWSQRTVEVWTPSRRVALEFYKRVFAGPKLLRHGFAWRRSSADLHFSGGSSDDSPGAFANSRPFRVTAPTAESVRHTGGRIEPPLLTGLTNPHRNSPHPALRDTTQRTPSGTATP